MTRSVTLEAVVHGLVNALINAGVGAGTAWLLWKGFTFDWYVHDPTPFFERWEVVADVALGLVGTGFVVALIVTGLAGRAWRKGHVRAPATPRFVYAGTNPVTGQAHALRLALALGAGLGVLGLLNATLVFVLLGADEMSGQSFYYLKIAAGAIGGFLAAWIATVSTVGNLAEGRVVRTPEGHNLLAAASLTSARHAGVTVLLVLALTGVMAVGVGDIHTNVDVADVLPRGDHNTEAAHNLTDKFKSAFTQQVTLQFHVDESGALWARDNARLPNRVTDADAANITDEVYVRAIDEAVRWIMHAPESPFEGTVNAVEFYKLINWTLEGGRDAPDAAFALPSTSPDGSLRYRSVHQAVWTAIPDTADAVLSPDYKGAAILLLVEPKEELSSKEIGEKAFELRDGYVEWASTRDGAFKVFTGENAPVVTVDLPVANAHSSELAEKDFELLLPVIAYLILIALFVAFRSVTSVIVTFSALAVGTVWTFGAMGYLDIALNTLNLTTIPLIMGVGIDYGIHMVNEWQHHRAEGRSNEEAFRLAGGRSALAMFVATATTVGGLFVMIVSPSKLIAELGILSAIAITSAFVLTLTFIPAAITLLRAGGGKQRPYQPSVLMEKLAGAVSRARVLVVAALVLGAALAVNAAGAIHMEEFGDPARNYLPNDPVRREHEEGLRGFYALRDDEEPDIKANVLVFEGNVTTPEAHAYMDAIEQSLIARAVGTTLEDGSDGRIIPDTLRTLPFLLRTYLTVRDGLPSVGAFTLQDGLHANGAPVAEPYPESRAEIEALLDEVMTTPLFEFSNLFIDYPDNRIAVMTFSVRAATYPEAEAVWEQVWAAVDENEAAKPSDVTVSFVGNTATNYLFVAKEVPWLTYMSVASAVLVFGLVLVAAPGRRAGADGPEGFVRSAKRRLKPALAVASVNLATGAFWLGALPSMDIGLAITLTLPIVFIFCIGSDYALHVAMTAERTGNRRETFRTSGKGVLFSFVTTFGAFLVFTQISDLAVRRTMVATALAIVIIFITTVLIMPVFYPLERESRPAETRSATTANGKTSAHTLPEPPLHE